MSSPCSPPRARSRCTSAAGPPPPPPPPPGENAPPPPERVFCAQPPPLGDWPLSRIASMSRPATSSTVVLPAQSTPLRSNAIDRVQLTAWALLRSQQTGVAGSTSLASGGTLGASQAGSRLTYNFTRQIAASVRTSTIVGRRGGGIAAGGRVQPLASLPVWVTAERRQQLGKYGGGGHDLPLFFQSGGYPPPLARGG